MFGHIEKIETLGIGCTFDDSPVPVFSGLDFSVGKGECGIFFGEPGCGKTVFLKILGGIMRAYSGELKYNGLNIAQVPYKDFTNLKKVVGFAFENGALINNMTLLDNIALPLRYHSIAAEEKIIRMVHEYAERFYFTQHLHMRPSKVSNGIRKMAGFVRAVITDPQVLYLDDPLLGIGARCSKEMENFLKGLNSSNPELILVAASNGPGLSRILSGSSLYRLASDGIFPVSDYSELFTVPHSSEVQDGENMQAPI